MANESQPTGGGGPLAGLRMLLVGDDAISAGALSAQLVSQGVDVRGARSAEDAMAAVRAFDMDVVVVDLVLPRMSGLLFVRQCRAQASMRCVIFVGISGLDGGQVERLALESGCTAYFAKPVDVPAFTLLVGEERRRYLEARGHERTT